MSAILDKAREVLAMEAEGITKLIDRVGPSFEEAVRMILASDGKVITTGIGKSGIIARKIMATLNSTGTNAIFLHPVEALHGDLGMVAPGDVVLALSHSGETGELVDLIPELIQRGAQVVAMTGGMSSSLASVAQVVIDCGVEREACPLGLAPTTSTTAVLAMGDALAVVLIEKRHFNKEDFRRTHPGGKLGEQLALEVSEVMAPAAGVPQVGPRTKAIRALEAMTKGDLGTVLIVEKGVLKGIYTDGDLRRTVSAGVDLAATPVGKVMTAAPMAIGPEVTAAQALHLMEEKLITALPVVDGGGRVLGLVHLHDILGRGRVSFTNLTRNHSC